MHLRQVYFLISGRWNPGARLPVQQFVWYPDVVHVQLSFEQRSYLAEQFLSFVHKTCCVVYSGPCWLSTGALFCNLPWTGASYENSVSVKTKDSCWKQYCLGLGSKMPLLADCKNIKHINSFGNRIKRVNESKVEAALFSFSHSSMQLGAIKCSWWGSTTTSPWGLWRPRFPLCFSLIPAAILIEKGIIK